MILHHFITFYIILQHFPKFQICASIDGTGEIGEYIRTGLRYNKWLENKKLRILQKWEFE